MSTLLAVVAARRHSGAAGQAAPVATTVIITGPSSVTVGSTVQLAATVYDQYGAMMAGAPVTWSSTAGATVSSTGLVTGQSQGSATITATSGSASGTHAMTVTAAVSTDVASVTLSSSTTSVWQGTALQYTATAKNSGGSTLSQSGRTVVWSSSDPTVAAVSTSGAVTGGQRGTATITCTIDGVAGSRAVRVDGAGDIVSVAISNVALSAWTPNLRETGRLQLVPVAYDATGASVSGAPMSAWASDDTGLATVGQPGEVSTNGQSLSGEVLGIAAGGPVRITVTCDGQTGFVDLTILPKTNAPALKAQPRTTLTYAAGASTLHCDAAQSSVPTGAITTEQFDLYSGRPDYGGTLLVSSGSQAFGTGHDFTGLADDPVAWVRCTVGDGVSSDTTDLFAPVETPAATPWARDQFDSGDLSYTSANGFLWGGGSGITSKLSRFGSYSKEFTFSGMYDIWTTEDWTWGEQRFTIGGEHKELWFELWVYYPDGTENLDSAAYQHRNGPSSDNNKFLQVWGGGSVGDENNAYYVKMLSETELTLVSSAGSERMGFKYGTNAALGGKVVSNYEFNNVAGADPCVDVTKDIGMWHCHRFWMKVGDIGAANGEEKYWLDGVLKVHATGLRNDPADGDPAKGYMYGYFQGWPNSGFDERTHTYVGCIAIFASDPGWT